MKPCIKCGQSDRYADGDCRVCQNAYSAADYAANPEKYKASQAARLAIHPEKHKAHVASWQKMNPGKVIAKSAKHRTAKKNSIPSWFGKFDELIIDEAGFLCKLREKETGIKWHVDHIVPLQSRLVCGFHIGCNIQVIPASINCSKGNRHWPDMP